MAKMDRSKLAAFAGKLPGDSEPEDAHEEDQEGGDSGDADTQEGGDGKFGQLIPLLEQFHEELEECGDDVDPDVLAAPESEMSEDDSDALMDAYNSLDGKLKKEMQAALPGIVMDKADELAQHLADESMIDDQDKFAALLFRFGQALA